MWFFFAFSYGVMRNVEFLARRGLGTRMSEIMEFEENFNLRQCRTRPLGLARQLRVALVAAFGFTRRDKSSNT